MLHIIKEIFLNRLKQTKRTGILAYLCQCDKEVSILTPQRKQSFWHCFCNTKDQTQGIGQAREMLYHWTTSPSQEVILKYKSHFCYLFLPSYSLSARKPTFSAQFIRTNSLLDRTRCGPVLKPHIKAYYWSLNLWQLCLLIVLNGNLWTLCAFTFMLAEHPCAAPTDLWRRLWNVVKLKQIILSDKPKIHLYKAFTIWIDTFLEPSTLVGI